jgi:hypothetical protein
MGGDLVGSAHINVNANTDPANRAMRDFSRDAQGRLRDVRGRFVSASDAARRLGDDINSTGRRGNPVLGRIAQAVRSLAGAASSAASSLGGSGGMSPQLMAVGAAAGASLLPALGAVVPMMAGVGVAAGTLKLAVAGVGDAVALAGTDTKKYNEALKKMGPDQREFTKSIVGLKKEFGPIGREIQKAALPGFTQAVKDAGPVVKILGDSMKDMGAGFGDAARGVGRLLKDSGFQDDLQANLKLGNQFVKDMTGSLGPFTRSLLDFGAASGPTLTAFSNGIGGLLSKGLPSMFDGLKGGIPGTAKMLDGLFEMVNKALGAIGRFAGQAARVLGPLFGETFKVGGDIAAGAMDGLALALDKLQPVFKDLTFGLKTIRDVGAIIGPTLKDTATGIAGAFLPIGDSVSKAVGPLQQLNIWVSQNRIGILEAARVFGTAMIDLTGAAINAAPQVIGAFKLMSTAMLTALDGVVSGAAHAFGWIPGIGEKLKGANRDFDQFKGKFLSGLDAAQHKASDFAASAAPKLAAGKLKLDINNWNSQIAEAKAKLKTVPASKQAALKATIADLEAKVRQAKGQLASVNDKTVHITSVFTTVGSKSAVAPAHRDYGATGGLYTGKDFKYRGYARGGLVDGPGTTTSDDVYAPWLSKDEFVVNAKQTARHLPLLKAINSGGLGMAAGGMAGAGADVAAGLASGMAAATGMVVAAARAMAAAVDTAVRAELQISSPSKKLQTIGKNTGAGFIKGLTGTKAQIAATAKSIAASITSAFKGTGSRTDDRLVKLIDSGNKRLQSLAGQRDSLVKKIAAANKFATDTATAARSTGSLASIVQEDAYSPKYVKGQMQASLNQIKAFTANVQKLQKKGLNKDLLRQILEMGPEQGAAFAKSLAGADAATIKQYNSLNSQISSASTKLGKAGADMLYDSGKQAGKGFLTGLKAQQKDIEKLMLSIAKSMQKSIRRALGINSPARKLIPDGINAVRGLALGVVRGLPDIRTAMTRVAGAVTGGAPTALPAVASPALGTVPSSRGATAGAPTIVTENHYYLVNQGVIGSPLELQNWFVGMLDNAARTNRIPTSLKQAVRSSLRAP